MCLRQSDSCCLFGCWVPHFLAGLTLSCFLCYLFSLHRS